MPRRCCVPCCKSNYGTATEYTSIFHFPKEETRRAKWVSSINRKDFVPGPSSVVCIHHFHENFIVREDKVTRDDGSLLVVPRQKPTLTQDAYPSIFPNQPSYMTTEPPKKRKSPSKRHETLVARDEENFANWCSEDAISSFKQLNEKVHNKLTPGWTLLFEENFLLLYKISTNDCPKILVSLKIFNDLTISIWHNDVLVNIKTMNWILGSENKCDKWTKFDCLVNLLNTYQAEDISCENKLSAASHLLKECFEELSGDEDEDNGKYRKIEFILEQTVLLSVKQNRYSPALLMWAAKVYFSHPAAYTLMRNSKVLTLPHPVHLKKLSLSLNENLETGSINRHIKYLKKKAEMLQNHERIVNVLLDEIYVSPCLSYKGGHIVGISENSNTEATTIQTFMIESLLSKNKDVIALIPTKHLKAEELHAYTINILELLVFCGYTVLCLISDNNSVNRFMFTIMCNGELKTKINNPADRENEIFLLFDTVHLLKSIRNNWLNQPATNKTFFFPDLKDHQKFNVASFQHLIKIYDAEKNQIVKQAPKLSQKVLFPTSTERQNVAHALGVFDDTNVVALQLNSETFGTDLLGTKTFISQILCWWKIVNVKNPCKGKHKRDIYCDPIRNKEDKNIRFLKDFSIWLRAWSDLSQLSNENKRLLNFPPKGGVLTKETQLALQHTTDTLIELMNYIFDTIKPRYILLGKFQTDSLEARFGQYRQMSGGNYNVSMRQVLESEKKLKILSLIHLKSEHLGDFKLKTFDFADSNQEETSPNIDIPEVFYDIFQLSNEVKLSKSVMSVLVYIAGYIANKVQRKLQCSQCSLILACEKQLEYECSDEDVAQYLQLTDRGGLKWPEEFTVKIVLCAFQIFQTLISEEFEKPFLSYTNQKPLLIQMCMEQIKSLNLIPMKNCRCELSLFDVARKCVSVMANILLNNYCKARNDKLRKKSNKRKLSTLTGSKAK